MLRLSPVWEKASAVVLVDGIEGVGMCAKGGWQEVPSQLALGLLDHAQRSLQQDLRRFVIEIRLVSSPLRELSDHQLLARVCGAIRSGRLLALRQSETSNVVSETVVLRRLVVQIEKATRGKLLLRGRA